MKERISNDLKVLEKEKMRKRIKRSYDKELKIDAQSIYSVNSLKRLELLSVKTQLGISENIIWLSENIIQRFYEGWKWNYQLIKKYGNIC